MRPRITHGRAMGLLRLRVDREKKAALVGLVGLVELPIWASW
jgi:hypothetical protein